jgi:hypothetical protein
MSNVAGMMPVTEECKNKNEGENVCKGEDSHCDEDGST